MEYFYSLILTYKYAILLPIAIIEGPMVIIMAAFLAHQGLLNIFAVYIIGVLGDLIGDAGYYWLGRYGSHSILPKYGRYVGITEERLKYVEDHYRDHLIKTLLVGKIMQTGMATILVAAGVSKVDFKRLFLAVTLITIPKVLIFTIVGYYFGASYELIGQYFDNAAIAAGFVMVIGILLYIATKRFRNIPPQK